MKRAQPDVGVTMAEIGIIKLGKQCDFEAHMIEHRWGLTRTATTAWDLA